MSQDVDRYMVFQTTKVRSPLKNDGCWIQQPKQDQDKTKTAHAVETRPPPVRSNSYVLSTAKKFDDSANQTNREVIPPQKDDQPDDSTVEMTHDANFIHESTSSLTVSEWPQAPIEQHENGEAQTEDSVANTTAENKEYAAVFQSSVEQNGLTADILAEAEACIQNGEAQAVSTAEETPETVEQPVANATAENKGDNAETTDEQSHMEHNEANVSADPHAEFPDAVQLTQPQEQPSTKPEPPDVTQLEDARVESAVQPEEATCEKQAAEDTVKAIAEVVAKPSSDTSDVVNATPGEEAAIHQSAETVIGVSGELSPDIPAVTDVATQEADSQVSVEPVPDLLADTATTAANKPEIATETSCEQQGPPAETAVPAAEAAAEVAVELSSESAAVTGPPEEAAVTGPPEEAAVTGSPEEAAVTGPAEEAAVQVSVEPVPDLLIDSASESLTQAAAETAVKHVECEVESAASGEPVLKTIAKEAFQCEVQPVDNTVVEQSVEPTPETAAVSELDIKDAVEAIKAPNAEALQDEVSDRPIELAEALDVEPPKPEASPEPPEDPKQSHTEKTELNQHSADTNTYSHLCSFCEKIIDGNVKLYFSEPVMSSHPHCLKCGVCAQALGDLLLPMFLHGQVIKCGSCFAKDLETED